jgi:hypothetical protein
MSSVIHNTDFQCAKLSTALSQSPHNERDLFISTNHVFLHLVSLSTKVIGRVSSTRLLDLETILKLESIREKPTELRLWYIHNGCCEIGNPLGSTDGPDLQAYRAARFAEQNWQDAGC